MGLQGKVTDNVGNLITGDITVEIWDAATGGNLIYNSTANYIGNISSGYYDLMLGSITDLDLNFSEIYYMDIAVNSEDIDWDDDERIQFMSSIGQRTSTFNISNNFIVNGATLYVEAENNRIGIGTDNPIETLNIDGTLNVTGLSLFEQNISFIDNLTVGGNVLYVDSSVGRIGIGTTTPSHTFNVVGDFNVTGTSYLSNMTFMDNATLPDSINISEDLEAGGVLFVDGRYGNVGIGTTSPASGPSITAANGYYATGSFVANPNLASVGMDIDTTAGVLGRFFADSAAGEADIGFFTAGPGGSERMRIQNTTGNVGIGTTSPTHTLNIEGNLNVTGASGKEGLIVDSDGNVTVESDLIVSGITYGAIPTGFCIFSAAETSCPSGWTRGSAFDGRVINGSEFNIGATGGSDTHTHSLSDYSVSSSATLADNSVSSSATLADNSVSSSTDAEASHTHSMQGHTHTGPSHRHRVEIGFTDAKDYLYINAIDGAGFTATERITVDAIDSSSTGSVDWVPNTKYGGTGNTGEPSTANTGAGSSHSHSISDNTVSASATLADSTVSASATLADSTVSATTDSGSSWPPSINVLICCKD